MELLAPNGNKSNLTAEQYELVRTPEFKAWFGDWENAPENASKFVDNNGEPKVMYHQTSDTVKNILYKEGIFKKGFESASKNDKETPYGFFFKKIKDNIGLKGVSQISVFLDSKKPLFFKERSDINLFFNDAVNGFSENNLEYERNDIEYQKEFNEQMKKASSMFKIHGTESDIGKLTRKTFEEESTELLGEWAEKNNDISVAQKKLMTDFLKNNDYDSMVIENDEGSFGRKTDATIVFDSNQIKLADGSNTTFDSSNPDIRFDDGGEITIDSKPFTDIPDYDMTIKEAFEAIADAPYDRGNAKYFGDWLKRLGWKIKFNRGIELDDWHEGGEEKTWRLFDRVAESNQEDGWIGTYYSRQEAEAHKRRLTLVLSKNNFVVKVNSNTNQIEVNSPDIRFDEGGEISKNIDSQLKKIGFTFNTANYRYGKNVDERTYISAFYDKNKQLYKIGGVKKFKTPLGGNSVGIKFEYDNKKEFWQKINEFTSTYNPDIRFEGGGVIDNPNFKKWFGDSKVVNDKGNPLAVYHGSTEEFYEFEKYSYFTDDWWNADGYANGEVVYEVYLSLQNPLVIDGKGKKWDEIETPYGTSTREVVDNVDKIKYDGIIFNNIKDSWIDDAEHQEPSTVYVAFSPNQIKLADGTTFDGNNPDIRFDEGGEVDADSIRKELIGIYSSVHENKRQSIISSEEGGKELLSLAINQGGNIGNSIAQASQNYLLLPMSIKLINNGYSNFSVEYYYFPKPNSNTRVKITYKELWDDEDYSESFTREQHKKAIMENPIPVLYDSTILNENGELINNKFKDIDSDSELRYGKKDADHLFRGMSKKELDSILVNGYIKSNASMNIGETQMNTTSFAQHISQASNYAYGFTAWYDSVVFDEPKYVVKVKRDGLKYSPTLPSDPDNEVDVFGEVPIENIVAIYEIRLGSARSGNFELVQEYNGTVREGSGSGAYTKAYFRKITDFKNSDIRFDDGGVVKENYFEGELSFLNW